MYNIISDTKYDILLKMPQFAFAVDTQTWTIYLSKSGHAKMTRGKDRHDYQGGWIFPRSRHIMYHCGSLDDVKDKQNINNALSNAFRINLIGVI